MNTERPRLHVPPGHMYSPIPSRQDVRRAVARTGRAGRTLPGIDLREQHQLDLLASWLPWYAELDFPHAAGDRRYHYDNTWFTYSDAICYALMLRHLRPKRVIEVGSGFTSALALDVDERHLGSATEFTFIDPDPERLRELLPAAELADRLLAVPLQDVPLDTFDSLAEHDVLFIDSSHVLRAGSDVQMLIDEVLPRLRPGVHIHFHDVFFPFEYPSAWLADGVALNEAYAVRALLQHSCAYQIVLFNSFLERFHRDWFAANMPLVLAGSFPTGGIWLRRL